MGKHIQDLARGSGTQLRFLLLKFKFSLLYTYLPPPHAHWRAVGWSLETSLFPSAKPLSIPAELN